MGLFDRWRRTSAAKEPEAVKPPGRIEVGAVNPEGD